MTTLTLRISASGMASIGLRSIKDRRRPYDAQAAISALHDGLMAVALGKITPAQAKEFFCFDDDSKFIGGVVQFTEKTEDKSCGT